MGQFVKPPSKGGKDVGVVPVVLADAFSKEFPALFEYLTLCVWDDGSPRVPATLLVFCEDGLFKICLNDRASGRSAWAAAASWERAFAVMEAMLASGDVEWRVKAPGGGKETRKKT